MHSKEWHKLWPNVDKHMVIFRKTIHGEIIAVFPGYSPNAREGYCFVRWSKANYNTQHKYSIMIARTVPADYKEYCHLKSLLESSRAFTTLVIRRRGPSKKNLDKWLRGGGK